MNTSRVAVRSHSWRCQSKSAGATWRGPVTVRNAKSLPFEIIRLAVTMYVRFALSLRQVEDLLSGRGIDICHEKYGSGGIALVRCLQPRSGSAGSIVIGIRTGAGTWMRYLCGSTGGSAIFDAPLTTKAKCSKFSQPRNGSLANRHRCRLSLSSMPIRDTAVQQPDNASRRPDIVPAGQCCRATARTRPRRDWRCGSGIPRSGQAHRRDRHDFERISPGGGWNVEARPR